MAQNAILFKNIRVWQAQFPATFWLQVHLFDIDIPGKISFKESETLSPGRRGTIVDTPHGMIAIGICYDLRFPELAQLYAKKGANIVIYPGESGLSTSDTCSHSADSMSSIPPPFTYSNLVFRLGLCAASAPGVLPLQAPSTPPRARCIGSCC
jgi:Carbon-nitrogen hydrolase